MSAATKVQVKIILGALALLLLVGLIAMMRYGEGDQQREETFRAFQRACPAAEDLQDEPLLSGDRIVKALQAYHAEKGSYPARLEELVQQYLEAVPLPNWGENRWEYESRVGGRGPTYSLGISCRYKNELYLNYQATSKSLGWSMVSDWEEWF